MAFVALVGLYACGVRRLRTEKRNAAYFLGLLAKIRFKGIFRGFIWVYRVKMYIRLSCGFRGARGALCV